jgi:3-oxoacyl-[acyl-carrier protein] reductase
MKYNFKDKKVLVVGASKGIGKAIAKSFSKEKAFVVVVARDEKRLKELTETMTKNNHMTNGYYATDLLRENPNDVAEKLLAMYGTFDIVVHAVGGSLTSRDPLGTIEEWKHSWMFNAGIAIDMNNKLINPMIEQGWGRVIHISSISAIMLRGNPLYASSKAFLNAYVTTVGRALAPTGVVMTSVMPGAVAFEGSYWDKALVDEPEKCEDFLRHHQAVNRFGTPQEIANMVLFLASDKASFMQAVNVPVDGGNM